MNRTRRKEYRFSEFSNRYPLLPRLLYQRKESFIMKQPTLQKTARFLSHLLTIGCVVVGILCILLPFGILSCIAIPFIAPEYYQEWWCDTLLNSGRMLQYSDFIFFLFCCLGTFLCIFLALYYAKKIFACISTGSSPFTTKTARQIRKIACCIIVCAVFSVLSVFKSDFASVFLCGVFALILFCISLIFDYGVKLQQEIDETL